MSNDLAIATVTATLSEWLRVTVEDDVDGAGVTMVRPDQLSNVEDAGDAGVNIFLYQVVPNTAFSNSDLPTRRAGGNVVQRPQVALDLNYLFTFYGAEEQLQPQRVMGSVVRRLHARPVLTREAIEATIASTGNNGFSYLRGSDLADQIERVKFTPVPMSLEELSKMWSVFFQTAYRLSMTYVGSLVLIEAKDNPQQGLPVRTRNLYVRPFRQPIIERLGAAADPVDVITNASTLLIEGKDLAGDITRVCIGGALYAPARTDVGATRIAIDLASAVPASGSLRAGLQGVQVRHRLLMGTPETAHDGVESNVAALLLRPRIAPAGNNYDITVTHHPGSELEPPYWTVTIRIEPDLGKDQRVLLLLNEYNVDAEPAAYTFIAEERTADGDPATFTVTGIETGEYLIRVQVDGAQSVLERDEVDSSPTYYRYIRPMREF